MASGPYDFDRSDIKHVAVHTAMQFFSVAPVLVAVRGEFDWHLCGWLLLSSIIMACQSFAQRWLKDNTQENKT